MKLCSWLFLLAVFSGGPIRADAFADYLLNSQPLDTAYTELLRGVQLEKILRECQVSKPDLVVARIRQSGETKEQIIKGLLTSTKKKCVEGQNETLLRILSTNYSYRPTLATVLAGFETRGYSFSAWQKIFMAWPKEEDRNHEFYQNPVAAYETVNQKQKRPLFILLNGSFSSHPLWHNKLAVLLDEELSHPHLLAFSGFMSPEFLSFKAKLPPLSSYRVAKDLYVRIEEWVRSRAESIDGIALVGSSGGGRLVVDLLAIDTEVSRLKKRSRLFNRRCLALSPALDLISVFATLDQQVSVSPIAEKDNLGIYLTNMGKEKARVSFQAGFSGGFKSPIPSIEDLLPFTGRERSSTQATADVEWRFFNQFISGYLLDVVNALPKADFERYAWAKYPSRHRCDTFFRGFAFTRYQEEGWVDDKTTFEEYTSMEKHLATLEGKLTIVFTSDDPVLADANYLQTKHVPDRVTSILAFAESRRQNIRIFHPEYGSHHAYFLDTKFLRKLLKESFSEKEDNR